MNNKPINSRKKVVVSVIGSHCKTVKSCQLAYKIGRLVAESGAVLVCGGLAGTMEAAAQGAHDAGGLTIGLLPGREKKEANPYIHITIPTSIGFARNAIVACAADIIVALPGSYGTNSEICYGIVFDRPVIDLGRWNIKGMIKPKTFQHASTLLRKMIKELSEEKTEVAQRYARTTRS
jgi:uncharacterized protein (TIGR00725 family)